MPQEQRRQLGRQDGSGPALRPSLPGLNHSSEPALMPTVRRRWLYGRVSAPQALTTVPACRAGTASGGQLADDLGQASGGQLADDLAAFVLGPAGLPPRLASAVSVPVPDTARYAVRTAMATGAICRVPIWVVRAARTIS